ncbi:hypothetical protein AAFF_G00405750 [Aldrovandia affinis]|uniref:Pentraxin family member n=1 Tax=Aldrovandia affinis TaxID=143900 RepID=A0AAD7SC02_9TELE|nr:hypothetical protein AAFF_G00405750 [Aldrovandia affinis]
MSTYGELRVLVATLLLCGFSFSSGLEVGLTGKSLIFPYETDYSYVRLTPQKPLELSAFTLCMRLATELQEERQMILFAYRTGDFDELNVWREPDGRISFYLSGDGVFFSLPPLTTFKTSLCLTWESKTGLSAFWMNGIRSARQVYKAGHTIRGKGTVLLGQDPDRYLGDYEALQSYVGEISDLNMWDFVFSEETASLASVRASRTPSTVSTAELVVAPSGEELSSLISVGGG